MSDRKERGGEERRRAEAPPSQTTAVVMTGGEAAPRLEIITMGPLSDQQTDLEIITRKKSLQTSMQKD